MQKFLLAIGFLACIPAANFLIGNVGTTCVPNGPCLIPVAPGLMAPSGVLVIGVALALRDAVQEVLGRSWVMALIAGGAALSLIFSPPALAVASAVAFLLSELLDFAVYDRLRRRQMAVAVLLSGLVGAVADSLLFSWLAFGTVKWAPGLIIAKVYASILFAVWLAMKRRKVGAE
jgi:queuosine precursor transporter